MENTKIISDELIQNIITVVIKIFIGFVITLILFKIINIVCKKLELRIKKDNRVDTTIAQFVTPLISKVLKFFVIVGYVAYLGIETSSIAAAITSQTGKARLPTHINIAGGSVGLSKDSVILLEQIRTIDKRRLREHMGRLDEQHMALVNTAIAVSFGLADN